jgi:hypothetical protein
MSLAALPEHVGTDLITLQVERLTHPLTQVVLTSFCRCRKLVLQFLWGD